MSAEILPFMHVFHSFYQLLQHFYHSYPPLITATPGQSEFASIDYFLSGSNFSAPLHVFIISYCMLHIFYKRTVGVKIIVPSQKCHACFFVTFIEWEAELIWFAVEVEISFVVVLVWFTLLLASNIWSEQDFLSAGIGIWSLWDATGTFVLFSWAASYPNMGNFPLHYIPTAYFRISEAFSLYSDQAFWVGELSGELYFRLPCLLEDTTVYIVKTDNASERVFLCFRSILHSCLLNKWARCF